MLLNASVLNSAVLNDTESGGGGDGGGGGFGGSVGRYVNGSDVALMLEGNYSTHMRVRIADPAGTLLDYSTRDDINWIKSVEYEGTVDAPVATAKVTMLRSQGRKSLAPFKTDSSYNEIPYVAADLTQGVGPSIDVGRRILIDAAAVALDALPGDEEWHLVFEGTIETFDFAHDAMIVDCVDKSYALQATWFPVPNFIIPSPANIQGALVELLDLAHLDVATPLEVPVLPDPEVVVGGFRYDIEPAMDAMQRLSQINGWDLRQRFSDIFQEFRLTFKDPGRDRDPDDYDFVLYPRSYIDVPIYKIDRTSIRNDITVNYYDAGLAARSSVFNDYSPESVRRYGRRSMVITEADDSPIQTADAARLMADLALYDIAEPIADKQIEMFYFWPIELHNRIGVPANLVHSDEILGFSVVGYRHRIEAKGTSRTTLMLRGKPVGSYWHWFLRKPVVGNPVVGDDDPPAGSGFGTLSQFPDYATDHIQFDFAWGGDPTATFDIYVQHGSGGFVLETTLSALTFTYDYDVGSDIEPFHTPPDPPQLPIYVDFYVVAHVTGFPDVQSGISNAVYGFGP